MSTHGFSFPTTLRSRDYKSYFMDSQAARFDEPIFAVFALSTEIRESLGWQLSGEDGDPSQSAGEIPAIHPGPERLCFGGYCLEAMLAAAESMLASSGSEMSRP